MLKFVWIKYKTIPIFYIGTWRCDPCKGLPLPSREKKHLNKMAANVKERYKKHKMKKFHVGHGIRGLVILNFVNNVFFKY